ncbi:MAG: GntR family transcriptional regulator [Dehalococcoidia bacterium]|nr:GntR family transcriptional regulator [Dehalococcoidia bacterium]
MPIYLQIIEQVKRAVALGEVAASDQLPTVKQLATDLLINPNTVAKAYRDLEREGVIETFSGKGSFVSATMVETTRVDQLAKFAGEIRSLIRDAKTLGLAPGELIRQFESEVKNGYGREDDVVSDRDSQFD